MGTPICSLLVCSYRQPWTCNWYLKWGQTGGTEPPARGGGTGSGGRCEKCWQGPKHVFLQQEIEHTWKSVQTVPGPHPPWAPATTRRYSSPQCLPSTAHRSLHRSLHRSGGGGHDEGSKAPALMEVPVADTWVWPLPHYHPLSGSQRRVPSLFVTFSRRSLSFRFTLHQGGGEGRPGAGPPLRASRQVRPARGREQCMCVAWAPTGELGPLGAWVGKRKPLSVLASL